MLLSLLTCRYSMRDSSRGVSNTLNGHAVQVLTLACCKETNKPVMEFDQFMALPVSILSLLLLLLVRL